MISHERPSPRGYRSPSHSHSHSHHRPYAQSSGYPPKPPVNEDTLKSEKIQIERKTFVLTLKENPRGRFLRITEDVNGRRDTIIIPATGLADFKRVIDQMVAEADLPPMPPEAEQPESPA
jgi:PurA ssDNA and RNA-binding protein